MRHPDRLTVHGWEYEHPMLFVWWIIFQAVGVVGIVGVVALVAHLLAGLL